MMRFWLAALLTLSVPQFAWSQADLTVIVTNLRNGKPLSGIKITVEHPTTGWRMMAETSDNGVAIFPSMPDGNDYQLTAIRQVSGVRPSLDAVTQTFSIHASPLTLYVAFVPVSQVDLDPAVVQSHYSAVDFNSANAEVAGRLTQRELRALPIEGRDVSRSLYRLPNVTQATGFFPEAPPVAINGANALYTSYLIDGMDNNEQFLGGPRFNIPVGFTRHIQVLTANYPATYGWAGNGVVNVTTPSGTNDITGEAFTVWRPGPLLDGASRFAQRDLSGNFVKDGFQRGQGGFAVGGPLLRDKTFFYVNAEHTTDRKDNRLISEPLGVNAIVRGHNRFNYLSARIDHHWSQHVRSFWRLHVGQTAIERQGGGLDGGVLFPSAGSAQDRNAFTAAWHNQYVKGKVAATLNVQYSRFRWNYGRPLQGAAAQVTIWDDNQLPVAVLGHPGFTFDELAHSWQVQQRWAWYAGAHTVKWGGSFLTTSHQLAGGGNPNGNYLIQLDENQLAQLAANITGTDFPLGILPADATVVDYSVELQPATFGVRQNLLSAFVSDDWQVTTRLHMSAGLRWSVDNLSRGGGTNLDLDNLAPNLALNYRLDNRTTIRGGYGLYFDKILYAIYSDALQQNTTGADYRRQLAALQSLGILQDDMDLDRVTFDGNLTASQQGIALGEGALSSDLAGNRNRIFSNERRILHPAGYQNPMTHHVTLGIQRQLANNTLLSVDAVHLRGEHLPRLVDLNAPTPYPIDPANVVVRSQAAADASRPVPVLYDTQGPFAVVDGDTLRGIARNITVTDMGGASRYYALSITLNRDSADDSWGYRFTYTLSRLENNTDDINFRAQDANDFEAEWGPSLNDRTHVINALLFWRPGDRWQVTTASLLQSGQPINRIPDATLFGTTDLNGDGRSFGDAYVGNSDRWPGESRNSDRLPWSVVFDISLQYELPVVGNRMVLRADVFNLFNAQNLSGYSNNATQSNQVQVGPAASGLLVQRNAGPPRQFQFTLQYAF